MGLEATSYSWLRDGIKRTVPHFALLERVENGVHIGTADVNYCIRGVEGWIELKAVPLPSREDTCVLGRRGLNAEQINWHLARMQVRSRTWVFITADEYRWLVPGMHADEVNSWTREQLCIRARFHYDEKWSARQWERLVSILTEPR